MSDKKLEIIVPYRDRAEDLAEFVPNVSKFLNHHGIRNYRITVVKQLLNAQFNRGKLLNVGFLESCNDSDYSVFHDVDVYPVIYDGKPVRGYELIEADGIKVEWHGVPNYHYHDGAWSILNPGKRSAGTICKIDNISYEAVNGHSNSFWGWGYEDNDLFYRLDRYLKENKKPRFLKQGKRPSPYHSAHFKDIRRNTGFVGCPEHVVNEAIGAKMWAAKKYNFKHDGLSSCNYRVDSVEEYAHHRILNVYL
jgi:hypothetical protein